MGNRAEEYREVRRKQWATLLRASCARLKKLSEVIKAEEEAFTKLANHARTDDLEIHADYQELRVTTEILAIRHTHSTEY